MSAELFHGGRLRQAAQHYAIPREQWLDLSTGINPNGWPVPALPPDSWRRLPEEGDGLEAAAAAYYGTEQLLPVAGSQAAIQLLPQLRPTSRVALLTPAYAEHARAWQAAGHQVSELASEAIAARLDEFEVVVVLNPNNPSGERFSQMQLRDWHARLAARRGWLVIDEAFIDATPQQSLAPQCGSDGLIVLRSLGKFFGLAGVRVGFLLAWPALLEAARLRLGPWSVSGPSREVARRALQDRGWQQAMRQQLHAQTGRLQQLLREHGLAPSGGSALFQWLRRDDALLWHEALAQRAILTRPFAAPRALRFGLPGTEGEWQRLATALEEISSALTHHKERRSCNAS
ncbi:MAG TPA: threonine-phosphate decarboxylase CobD [Gammaproteobacteria bacterium]